MLLQPRKVKYRKTHRGRIHGHASRKTNVSYGEYGLQSLGSAWVTARQIEAARRAMTRFVQRGGKIWVRIFPDKAITQKGSEVRMGGGKGPVDHYVSVVKPGMVLFEITGVPEKTAREALRLASAKLPVKSRFLSRELV